ncbi:MAG: glucose-6-phosphate dehydrogenase [Planctomycetes bacterium]|nr:glucose-6-phosphate dehydrogenase [Planctomycetota bacterium]
MIPRDETAVAQPCVLAILGASGDLCKRLLMPTLYNLACDGLLPANFAIVGMSRDPSNTDEFRKRMSDALATFQTRAVYNPTIGEELVSKIHYIPGDFDDPAAYTRLEAMIRDLESRMDTGGNVLVYLATAPVMFGPIANQLAAAGFVKRPRGWTRLIVEKPFGKDLHSARDLNKVLLANWAENQIYRIDHYLGKETVQNFLAFRFSNLLFESVWNREHIDHIQLTASEAVGVEGRGGYYDKAGVLRDMIQNHLLQVISYVAMERPESFQGEAIRNAKAKLYESVRVYSPDEVRRNTVRGQYGPGKKPNGTPAVGYREEPSVPPTSITETFAALRLFIDNDRWRGVPFFIRSGKSLWKRGTELVVQFKKSPADIFKGTTAAEQLDANRLVFHIQPDQGIEFRFSAKSPGTQLSLQKVNMRFDYKESFEAFRGTGYEILIYNALLGDMTLFSRDDLVDAAWRIVQPILDVWATDTNPDFPNYPAGSWGPKAASALIEDSGFKWIEILNRESLARIPLFASTTPVFLNKLAMTLKPAQTEAGEMIVRKGEAGHEMYILCRGQAEATDEKGTVLKKLEEGDYFGELSLLDARPRAASVKAVTHCDLLALHKTEFDKLLAEHPDLARDLRKAAVERYK